MFNRLNLERVKKKATVTNNYGCKVKKRLQVVFFPLPNCLLPYSLYICPNQLGKWDRPRGPWPSSSSLYLLLVYRIYRKEVYTVYK